MLIIYIIFVLFVRLFIKIFPFAQPDYQINNVKKSAIKSLFIIAAEIMIIIIYVLIVDTFIRKLSNLGLMLMQSSIFILMTAIVLMVVLHKKESLQSIGITKINLMKSSILGISLGIIFFVVYQISLKTNHVMNILTIASLMSFIEFIIVGFSEEIICRGYLQTRLIAWQGTTKGCLITAIIFSFYHLPVNLVFKSMDFQSAFLSCVNLIPLSLILGYIMLKTKNITSVSILHTFIDWTIHL